MVHETTLDASMEGERERAALGHGSPSNRDAGAGSYRRSADLMTHISSRYDDKAVSALLAECRAIFRRRNTARFFCFPGFSAPFFVLIADNTKKAGFHNEVRMDNFQKDIALTGPNSTHNPAV